MKFDSPKMESIALLSLQLASYGGFIKDKSAGAQRSTMKKFLRNPPWGFFS